MKLWPFSKKETLNTTPPKPKVKASDEASRLALDYLYPIFGTGPKKVMGNLDIWLEKNYDHDIWVPRLAETQELLNKYFAWAETLTDDGAKDAYLSWLNYYQKQLEEGKKELINQTKKKEMEEYDRKIKEAELAKERLRIELEESFPKPPALN